MDAPLKRHNFTLYYSNFTMFNDSQSLHILKSSVFKEKLLKRLGIEWTCYASEILYQENIDHRVFLKENAVFEAALSVWLALHEENELNGLEKLDFDDSFERFEANFSHKFMIFKKNEVCFKAVLQAFFATANQVWSSLPETLQLSKKTLKTHSKEVNRIASMKRKVSNMSTIKPLVLVSQGKRDYCDLKEALGNMTINEGFSDQNEIYVKKLSKLEEQILSKLDFRKYLSMFVVNSKEKWHIARGFVTNMFELNYNRIIELENTVSSTVKNFKNNVRVRVLQPAESFYQHLMKIWLMVNDVNMSTNSSAEVLFSEYLQKVKDSMGTTWSEKYKGATELFFETLLIEWRGFTMETNREEQNLALLIKKVREDFMKLWDENIIRKIEDL